MSGVAGVLYEAETAFPLRAPGFSTGFWRFRVANLFYFSVLCFCFLRPVSCVPMVASFSGLSILDWPFRFLWRLCNINKGTNWTKYINSFCLNIFYLQLQYEIELKTSYLHISEYVIYKNINTKWQHILAISIQVLYISRFLRIKIIKQTNPKDKFVLKRLSWYICFVTEIE